MDAFRSEPPSPARSTTVATQCDSCFPSSGTWVLSHAPARVHHEMSCGSTPLPVCGPGLTDLDCVDSCQHSGFPVWLISPATLSGPGATITALLLPPRPNAVLRVDGVVDVLLKRPASMMFPV